MTKSNILNSRRKNQIAKRDIYERKWYGNTWLVYFLALDLTLNPRKWYGNTWLVYFLALDLTLNPENGMETHGSSIFLPLT